MSRGLEVRATPVARDGLTGGGKAAWGLRRAWDTRTRWGPAWAARVVLLLGLVSLVSAVVPPWRNRLSLVVELLPRFAPPVAAGATAAAGLLLVALSSALRRGKRRAWQVATGASALLVVLHLVKGLDVEEAALSAAVLGLLAVTRGAFPGVQDPRTRWRPLGVFAITLATATAAGAAAIMTDPDESVTPLTVRSVLTEVWSGMVGVSGPLQFRSVWFDDRISQTLLLLGVSVVGLTLAAALRPADGPHRLTDGEALRLRELVTRHGEQDSLAYFALRDDKSVIFSDNGRAAVAFTVVGGVSLASGDPLGDPESWPAAIAAWLRQAERFAWSPGVLAASERAAEEYARSGLDALELGDEAILEVADFSLQGRQMRGVRQAVSRTCRQGYTVQVSRVGDLEERERQTLAGFVERWRDGPIERGFSMALGRFGDPRDGDAVVVVARDGHDQPQGLLGFVPWGRHGLSLDLMRRRPGAVNGVVELMVTELARRAPDLGVERISLNFAVFRSVFERAARVGAGPVLRLWHRILLIASRFWQIESLYRANAKYRPRWEPRYLCFRRAGDLPRVAAAALQAEAFLRRPAWVRRLMG